jgi:hypothetical protein
VLDDVLPISGRAGAAPAREQQEAYPPSRLTAWAGYPALPGGRTFGRWRR